MEIDLISINRGFSRQSSTFDDEDAGNPILQWMRGKVRRHVLRHLKPGSKILEINAGTGIDAVYFARQDFSVHASDLSDGMIAEIKKKIDNNGLREKLSVQQISYRNLDQVENSPFDFIFSNFSGLNCIDDLHDVSRHMRQVLNPGGYITMVIMPRICPWELGLVLKGNFRRAFRRLKKGGDLAHLDGERFMTYYFSPADVRKAFGRNFEQVSLEGLGCFSPPPHKKGFAIQHPKAFRLLTMSDDMMSGTYPFDRWADHFIITLRYMPLTPLADRPQSGGQDATGTSVALHESSVYTSDSVGSTTMFFFLKSLFDITFSLFFCLFILSWLVPLLAILIKLDSKGPVFFFQKRTGYDNKEFYCIKLRTMRMNDSSDMEQATDSDQRITRFGYFLRHTNLDEMPQFINVLKGDMSVIGPRPHMIHHTQKFAEMIQQYNVRHRVKPGITGLAQVKGWRGPTPTFRSIRKRVQWDIFYIGHRNIRMEAYIFFATFREVVLNFWRQLFD